MHSLNLRCFSREVDLAGSERLAKSGVSGDRAKEAGRERTHNVRTFERTG